MFRNKDGSKFINEQNEMFLKELRAIYENKKLQDETTKNLIKEEEIDAIEKFIYLLLNDNNNINKLFQRVQNRIYKLKQIKKYDSTYSVIEKNISSRLKKLILENVIKNKYMPPKELEFYILTPILKSLNPLANSLEDYYKFRNKYKKFLQKERSKIKNKVANFKRTKNVHNFLTKYEEQIDINRLIKYLALKDLSSNKKDIDLIDGILQIILKDKGEGNGR